MNNLEPTFIQSSDKDACNSTNPFADDDDSMQEDHSLTKTKIGNHWYHINLFKGGRDIDKIAVCPSGSRLIVSFKASKTSIEQDIGSEYLQVFNIPLWTMESLGGLMRAHASNRAVGKHSYGPNFLIHSGQNANRNVNDDFTQLNDTFIELGNILSKNPEYYRIH